jgi:peptidoglycan biosynthesis protein MviN/MurJ (putative lipid II flippase)
MNRTRALLGPSTVMATGTVVSRITGIARDIALAAALGFYLVSDAYSLGNSLPTIIYILVVGGALNAVFIPQLVRRAGQACRNSTIGKHHIPRSDICSQCGGGAQNECKCAKACPS